MPAGSSVRTLDTAFAEMTAATERLTWDQTQLSTREKVLLSILADVCDQALGRPFARHVEAGLSNGLTTSDIRELLRCVAFETGYHKALAAFERLDELEGVLGAAPHGSEAVDGGEAENAAANNSAAAGPPAPVRASWYDVDPVLGDFLVLQSGIIGKTVRLSLRERAFCAILVDVLCQTLAETFATHVGRALSGGADPEDIRSVIRFSTQFGVTRAWNAFRALDRLSAERA